MFCTSLVVLCLFSFGHGIVCLLVMVLSVFWSWYCLSFGHDIVCLLVMILSVFWSWYRLSFGHGIVCLLVMVSSVFWSWYCLSFSDLWLLINSTFDIFNFVWVQYDYIWLILKYMSTLPIENTPFSVLCGVFVLCWSSFCALCVRRIVHSWLPLRFSLTFYF